MRRPGGRICDLENQLKPSLETEIIETIAVKQQMEIRRAMDIYYRSKLSRQISAGEYGIQYLNAGYLVDDLIENEHELFTRSC